MIITDINIGGRTNNKIKYMMNITYHVKPSQHEVAENHFLVEI